MDMNYLLKQAKQMQNRINKIENELNESEYTASAGGDTVKVTIKGTFEVTSIEISDELLEKDNKEMLQDLVMVAVNSAVKSAVDDKNAKMGSVTQGVKFPGMF